MRRTVIILGIVLGSLCWVPAWGSVSCTALVVGYNDMDEMLLDLGRAYQRVHPEARVCFDLPATRAAPAALAEGRSDLAPMGAEMTSEDRSLFESRGEPQPVDIRIAHDSLRHGAISSPTGVFVHRGNPLRSISLAQLRQIFGTAAATGVSRWGRLGLGPPLRDRPVHAMSLGGETAIGRHLLRHVLQAQRFRDDVRPFHESSDVARAVASDPDALGLFNLSHRSGKVRALGIVDDTGRVRWPIRSEVAGGRYPLDRFLLVYARRDSSGHLGAFAVSFLQFMLSDEGQDIIARGHKGYIPLDREERAIERTKLVR